MLFRFNSVRAGALLLLGILAAGAALPAFAAERTSFNVAWSIYVGWMPWDMPIAAAS
jgi:NitT/TauT family transport system substrate-binding protein